MPVASTHRSELILYTRPDCHLCEVAARLLDEQGLDWRLENIESSLGLLRRFGNRIPVLTRPEDGAELFWPFDLEDLKAFLD